MEEDRGKLTTEKQNPISENIDTVEADWALQESSLSAKIMT